MQNLPFLATKVAKTTNSTQQPGLKNQLVQNGQSQQESNSVFKQILSKQSEQKTTNAIPVKEDVHELKSKKITTLELADEYSQKNVQNFQNNAHVEIENDNLSKENVMLASLDVSNFFGTQELHANALTLSNIADKPARIIDTELNAQIVNPMMVGMAMPMTQNASVQQDASIKPSSPQADNGIEVKWIEDTALAIMPSKEPSFSDRSAYQFDVNVQSKAEIDSVDKVNHIAMNNVMSKVIMPETTQALKQLNSLAVNQTATMVSAINQSIVAENVVEKSSVESVLSSAMVFDKLQATSTSIDAQDLTTLAVNVANTPLARPIGADQIQQTGQSNIISNHLGNPAWNEAIGQKIVWMLNAEVKSATLTLNPPDLGPLQVVIQVNHDKADTVFVSDNPDVRKTLENNMPILREYMGQAGIELGQTNVNSGKQHQAFEQAAKEQIFAKRSSDPSEDDQDLHRESLHSNVMKKVNNGLVDTFA